ncbi:MAG TPA: MlaD family protein [Candidatus Baltobacteraceae bacterium]|jgi:phospholipid/cholesterol/gamma-HCH transport system substrate-binding protein|nr:MlaD family protein [Candidatus Baltobacteraceae bacterium]
MSRQAIVGLFTLIAIIVFAGFLVILTDFGTRASGYRIGVRFQSASGLEAGAAAFLSGVPIGTVDQVVLEPDYTTDVIVAIKPHYEIPRGSRFLIQAPLTGEPVLLIVPPKVIVGAAPTGETPVLPHEVLALDQQPRGFNSASVGDLFDQGQNEVQRFDKLLAQLQQTTPALLKELQATLHNTNQLTQRADLSLLVLSRQVTDLVAQVSTSLNTSGNNVVSMTNTLNQTTARNSQRVDSLLATLQETSSSLNRSTEALAKISGDPKLHENVVETTHQLEQTTESIHSLVADLRQVTGNPQTQGQLRDAVAQLDATAQRINSLAGSLGGRSNVYGVDSRAKPEPTGSSPSPAGAPTSTNSTGSSSFISGSLRVSELATDRGVANRTPVLANDRGPQSDVNVYLLPNGRFSMMLGENDIGNSSTTNLGVLLNHNDLHFGGGILYSRLGVLARVDAKRAEFETRFYDPRHPTLDSYVGWNLFPQLEIFAGERDLLYPERRATLGLQLNP